MLIETFILQNRAEIDDYIKTICPDCQVDCDEEREEWIMKDEYLFSWAIGEGVDIQEVINVQKVYVEKAGGKYESWMYQGGKKIMTKSSHAIREIVKWAKKEGLKLVHVIEQINRHQEREIVLGVD